MSQSNFVVYQFADQLLAEVVLIISPFAYEKTTSELFCGTTAVYYQDAWLIQLSFLVGSMWSNEISHLI